MENKTLRVVDEQGNEFDYEIILTFKSDETEKSYVIYKEPGDTDEVFAASFDEEEKDGGQLTPIETDEEWDMVEEVLNAFLEEEDEEEEETR